MRVGNREVLGFLVDQEQIRHPGSSFGPKEGCKLNGFHLITYSWNSAAITIILAVEEKTEPKCSSNSLSDAITGCYFFIVLS